MPALDHYHMLEMPNVTHRIYLPIVKIEYWGMKVASSLLLPLFVNGEDEICSRTRLAISDWSDGVLLQYKREEGVIAGEREEEPEKATDTATIMSMPPAAVATTTTALSFKHSSLSTILPRQVRRKPPYLLYRPTTTVLTARRAWVSGDGVLLFTPAVLKSLRSSYRFQSSAITIAAGGDSGAALVRDAGAMAFVMAGAYALVFTFDILTQRNLMEQVSQLLCL
ncbi:phytol kinase [Sarracenia purpurea var. burkii]